MKKIRIIYRCALCGTVESVVREIEEDENPAFYMYAPLEDEPHHCGRLLTGDAGQLPYHQEKGERYGHRQRIGYKMLEGE